MITYIEHRSDPWYTKRAGPNTYCIYVCMHMNTQTISPPGCHHTGCMATCGLGTHNVRLCRHILLITDIMLKGNVFPSYLFCIWVFKGILSSKMIFWYVSRIHTSIRKLYVILHKAQWFSRKRRKDPQSFNHLWHHRWLSNIIFSSVFINLRFSICFLYIAPWLDQVTFRD